MRNKKFQLLNVTALAASLLPLAALLPVLLKITLPEGVRSIWAGINIICVILGLLTSAACVKNSERRSILTIAALVISCLWLLMMAGIAALALFINFLQ